MYPVIPNENHPVKITEQPNIDVMNIFTRSATFYSIHIQFQKLFSF